MIQCLEQTFQDMGPLFGLIQFILCTAYHHIMPVTYKISDDLLQIQCARTPFYQRNIINIKGCL